jgi:excisionase family DNA binding protein
MLSGTTGIEQRLEADGWISVREAARRLELVPKTIYRWVERGDLTAFKGPRRIYVRIGDFAPLVGEIGMRLLRREV